MEEQLKAAFASFRQGLFERLNAEVRQKRQNNSAHFFQTPRRLI